jgi:archaellum component FlaF (FlaF/FlaG flagellin family)
MESVVTAFIMIAVLVLAVLGLTQYSLNAQSQLADATLVMQERLNDRARTQVSPIGAVTAFSSNAVDITLKNNGTTKLADFNKWDVILRYTDSGDVDRIRWYSYPSQWTVKQILEIIEPGIFNPGETMTVTVNVSPAIKTGSSNLAIIATPNGITASMVFTR